MYGKARKFVKRGAKAMRKRYTAKPGGRKATGGVRVAKMAKDILYLKSVLNPEKKRLGISVSNQAIGQCNGNTDGAYVSDVTPIVSVGSGSYQRTGASIKLHSSIWHFQFTQGVGTIAKVRGIIEIYEVVGDPYTGFAFFNERFDTNPFTGVRDMNCQLNPDNFMKVRCLATRKFQVESDATSGVKLLTDIKIPMKYNKGQGKHIRYDGSSDNIANGQMYIVIRTDRGNISSTTVSTLNVPDVNINTGLLMQWNRTDYYYDN